MWEKLSISEKAAIRKLALGYIYDVPQHLLSRLVLMGLVEQGPNPRLTEAGLQLHRIKSTESERAAEERQLAPNAPQTPASGKVSPAAVTQRASTNARPGAS